MEQQLTAAGFNVVPLTKVKATEAFKKINAPAGMLKTDDMVSVAPLGLKVYDPMEKIDPNGSFFLGVANMNGKLESEIAQEAVGDLKDVAVLRVTLNLAYGTFEVETSSYTAVGSSDSDSASAKVGFVPVMTIVSSSPTVTPQITGMEFQSNFESFKLPNGATAASAKDFSRIQLVAPLQGSVRVSELKETTTTGEKAASASVALVGLLLRQGSSLEVGSYQASVDAAAFSAESKALLTKLAGMLASKLQ